MHWLHKGLYFQNYPSFTLLIFAGIKLGLVVKVNRHHQMFTLLLPYTAIHNKRKCRETAGWVFR